MAYAKDLAGRVRSLSAGLEGYREISLFGGLAFMYREHMFAGVLGERLIARLGPEGQERALRQPGVSPMDFSGRPLKGHVYVDAAVLQSEADLQAWLSACISFVQTLPPRKT